MMANGSKVGVVAWGSEGVDAGLYIISLSD